MVNRIKSVYTVAFCASSGMFNTADALTACVFLIVIMCYRVSDLKHLRKSLIWR